ncbi:MAG: hypothetical protein ACTIJ9_06305, partial [Aequorivita sp.]
QEEKFTLSVVEGILGEATKQEEKFTLSVVEGILGEATKELIDELSTQSFLLFYHNFKPRYKFLV